MSYTINPKERHAKASAENLRVSTKDSIVLSRAIRGKKLTTAKRLLNDLSEKKRDLDGKYHSKAVGEFIELLNSCEKNADNTGLERSRLFLHCSATHGSKSRRRRRKSKFGSQMKTTNLEMILIER
ncbi:MAG: hypothetical protein HZB65_02895 [Candidatus Aenigmarchaeota archaeon]|nr:hypothetical protein [Candidatus Aenigmarchaeota archaeon]